MLELRAALAQCPIAAILRGVTPDEIDAIGDALVEAGVTIIEVPLNSPNPFESIRRLAARHGARALIGAGTVLEPADVARVKDAGGRLMVAPNFDADVVHAAKAASLATLPGVMTPSEGFAALKAGADGLKLFPAEIIPPAVFKAWRAVFPADTLMLAVGGVGVDNLKSYAEAGASGYGIGSALYKPGRPAGEIGRLARGLVAAAKA
jgi:2-dehydro-3-deoxyphosphogalactonate aldolase